MSLNLSFKLFAAEYQVAKHAGLLDYDDMGISSIGNLGNGKNKQD